LSGSNLEYWWIIDDTRTTWTINISLSFYLGLAADGEDVLKTVAESFDG